MAAMCCWYAARLPSARARWAASYSWLAWVRRPWTDSLPPPEGGGGGWAPPSSGGGWGGGWLVLLGGRGEEALDRLVAAARGGRGWLGPAVFGWGLGGLLAADDLTDGVGQVGGVADLVVVGDRDLLGERERVGRRALDEDGLDVEQGFLHGHGQQVAEDHPGALLVQQAQLRGDRRGGQDAGVHLGRAEDRAVTVEVVQGELAVLAGVGLGGQVGDHVLLAVGGERHDQQRLPRATSRHRGQQVVGAGLDGGDGGQAAGLVLAADLAGAVVGQGPRVVLGGEGGRVGGVGA